MDQAALQEMIRRVEQTICVEEREFASLVLADFRDGIATRPIEQQSNWCKLWTDMYFNSVFGSERKN